MYLSSLQGKKHQQGRRPTGYGPPKGKGKYPKGKGKGKKGKGKGYAQWGYSNPYYGKAKGKGRGPNKGKRKGKSKGKGKNRIHEVDGEGVENPDSQSGEYWDESQYGGEDAWHEEPWHDEWYADDGSWHDGGVSWLGDDGWYADEGWAGEEAWHEGGAEWSESGPGAEEQERQPAAQAGGQAT